MVYHDPTPPSMGGDQEPQDSRLTLRGHLVERRTTEAHRQRLLIASGRWDREALAACEARIAHLDQQLTRLDRTLAEDLFGQLTLFPEVTNGQG